MNSETDLHIPIFVRAHARLAFSPCRREWQRKPLPQWARHALILDTETTRTLDPKLNFGFARWCELDQSGDIYVSQEEFIFHRNKLDPKSIKLLREFARKHKLEIMSRDEFVNGPLWDAVMAGAVIVGFNLPYDISVLAHTYREAGEGWSFIMWPYPNGRENKRRPRIRITVIDSHRAIIKLTGGRPRNKDGKPSPCPWPVPGGRFLDLAHMVFALRNSYFSLNAACKEFKVPGKLEGHEPTGRVTPEEIRYARQDVQATLNLLNAVKREFGSFELSIRPEQVLSPASLTKGFLNDTGLLPPAKKFANVPDDALGKAMQAYYGGRVECRNRHADVSCVYYDATSEYSTVAVLLDIWELIRAREVQIEDYTSEAQELLRKLTLEQLLDRDTFKKLAFFAKIKPAGDLLPVRGLFDGKTHTIGINYLNVQKPLWYAGPDLAANRIDGHVPHILEAFRLVPVGIQDGLKDEIKLGNRLFHPATDNFFSAIIEERHSLKQADKQHPHVLLLKIIASALYGCFAELNTKTYSRRKLLEVFSGDYHSLELSNKVEFPGKYSFIPAASLIASGGRLLLMMFEKLLEQAGGYHAMTDTDSVIVIASESGGLVPCEHGLERMPDGRVGVPALTWKNADETAYKFDVLNPYNKSIIPHLFKKEDCNLSADGKKQIELRYFGIASKRYTTFRGSPLNPEIIKPSQSGVGCYFKPDPRKRVQARDCRDDTTYPALAFDDWRYILREHFSCEPGILDGTHPFLDQLAMRKVRINTPRELASLRKLDPRKARPFSFCISPIILEDYRHAKPVLIAPMTDNPEEWIKLKYVDVHTGKTCYLHDRAKEKIVNGKIQTDRKRPLPQLYLHALAAFYHHPESKYPGGDGSGLLGRWHVHENDRRYLGKEVERKVQAGDSLAEILEPQPLEYKMRANYSVITKRVLHPAVIQVLKKKFSVRKLARKAKVDTKTVMKALRAEYIWPESWRKLMRVYEGLPP